MRRHRPWGRVYTFSSQLITQLPLTRGLTDLPHRWFTQPRSRNPLLSHSRQWEAQSWRARDQPRGLFSGVSECVCYKPPGTKGRGVGQPRPACLRSCPLPYGSFGSLQPRRLGGARLGPGPETGAHVARPPPGVPHPQLQTTAPPFSHPWLAGGPLEWAITPGPQATSEQPVLHPALPQPQSPHSSGNAPGSVLPLSSPLKVPAVHR